jgi:WD40 repeat protein
MIAPLPEDMDARKPPDARPEQATFLEQPGEAEGSRPSDAAAALPADLTLDDSPAPRADRAPLSRLADYELLAEVGRGGMGIVFKARHVRLGRTVALKMILGGALADAEDLQRFETEAAAAAQLQHPGIVALYEVGSHESQPYFSMEFISGSSLAQRVGDGPLPGRQAASYIEATARAVHYAHERGIIHRDLKPANILLDENDLPKVTDFGLAKLLKTDSGQTRTGAVLGTPSYMAPEQAAGHKDLGPACDVYSLGAILYELLTGRPPFRGETALATLKLVAEREPVPPRQLNPAIDRDLETICLKCLDKDPSRRYPTAGALADDLRRFLSEEPISARRLGPVGRAVKWARRKPAAAALLVVSAIAVLGFVIFQWQAAEEERALRREAERSEQKARDREEALRHLLYVARIRQVQHALDTADLDRAERLLAFWEQPSERAKLRDWEWYLLKEQTQGRFSLTGHDGRTTALAYRPDGKRLASAGGEPNKAGDVKIWDVTSGRLLHTVRGHSNSISAVAYSPDGKRLATASYEGSVKLWDADTGNEVATLSSHNAALTSVAFSPDGLKIVSGGADNKVRVWQRQEGGNFRLVHTLEGHKGEVTAVAFSPAGDLIASGSRDGTSRIWDSRTGAERQVLRGHQGEVLCLAFSPGQGNVLATGGGRGSKRGEVFFWDAATGKLQASKFGLSDRVLSISFSSDHKLAAGGSDGLIHIWDQSVSSEPLTFRGDPKLIFALAFSPDGRRLACAGRGGKIRLWNSSGGQETASFPALAQTEAVAVGPGGRLAFAGRDTGPDGVIHVWDQKRPQSPTVFKVPSSTVFCIALRPDGKQLAVGSDDNLVRLFDLTSPANEPVILRGHRARVTAVAYGRDGLVLASASEDDSIRLWNPQTGTSAGLLTGHANGVLGLSFSPDGWTLASGSFDKTVRIWDLKNESSFALTGHTGSVNAVAFSPDGHQVASGSSDKTIRVWDLASRKEFLKLEGAPGPVYALAYHPGGRRLASVGQDNKVRLWDLVTAQEILELDAGAGSLRSVAFSHDGRRLAAVGQGSLVRVWEEGPRRIVDEREVRVGKQ